MSQQHFSPDPSGDLRARAEAELAGLPEHLTSLLDREQTARLIAVLQREPHLTRLIHALRVHQAELVMQGAHLRQVQERLQTERERYHELYQHAPVSYLTTTAAGIITAINARGEALLGVSALAAVGASFTAFIVPADHDTYTVHRQQLHAHNTPQTCELRLAQPDGQHVHVRLESTAVADASGDLHYRTALFDVSQRVAAEVALQASNAELEERVVARTAELEAANAALRVSEARFRLVLSDSATVVSSTDDQLRYTWLYPAPTVHTHLLGKTDREVAATSAAQYLTPTEAAHLMRVKQQVLTSGAGLRAEMQLTFDGVTCWYDLKLEPLRDSNGDVQGVGCVMTDITSYHAEREQQRTLATENARLYEAEQAQRLRAEAVVERLTRLQRVTAQLSEARSSNAIFAIIVGEGAKATGAYAGGVALLSDDGSRIELVRAANYPADKIAPWQHALLTAGTPIATCIREGRMVCIPDRATLRRDFPAVEVSDQSKAWAHIPLSLHGEVRGCFFLSFPDERAHNAEECAFLQNLGQQCAQALERAQLYETEQAARAAAEEAIRVRDHVFRLVSHDLRSPLTAVLGYLQLGQRHARTSPVNADRVIATLGKAEQATQSLARQIQELHDVAIVQAGEALVLQREPCDLIALLTTTIEMHQLATSEHRITLHSDASHLPLNGDVARLERVFSNLLSNALKYSPAGGTITVTVTVERTQHPPQVSIAVQDHGVGIPAAALPTIFEPFTRAHGDTVKGTGLGLTSVRQIVEEHGGNVTVQSKEGEGSTFTVWLPCEAPDDGNRCPNQHDDAAASGV